MVAQAADSSPAEELILSRSPDGIATLTLNRPHRKNAVPHGMWEKLRAVFHEVMESDARVLIVTGAGDAFCAGADLSSGGEEQSRPAQSPLESMYSVSAAALARAVGALGGV